MIGEGSPVTLDRTDLLVLEAGAVPPKDLLAVCLVLAMILLRRELIDVVFGMLLKAGSGGL